MGQTRQSMRGPIVKPMGSGKTWKLKPFSTKNYASWLGNLTKRGTVRSLDSLGGVSLNTRIMRRTCLSYIASIASIEQAQALAGHACIGTTANYYVGFKDDELAEVRVAHSLRLLGSIPFFTLLLKESDGHNTQKVQPLAPLHHSPRRKKRGSTMTWTNPKRGRSDSSKKDEPAPKRQCAPFLSYSPYVTIDL